MFGYGMGSDFNCRTTGFTLVEMSVVLVISGLLIATAITAGTAQITQSRILSTKSKEESVKLALISFIARNNRLPCPAIPTLEPGELGYGVEADTPGTCTGVPSSSGVYTGVLPWSSMGMSNESASDGYYNRFTYKVTALATNLDANRISGMTGNITVHTKTPTDASNQSNNCANGLAVNPCAAVAVIVSHGQNGFGAYTPGGIRLALPGGSDEAENTDGDNAIVVNGFTSGDGNPIDDLLLTLTPDNLLIQLRLNGALKDSKVVIQEQFDAIKAVVVSESAKDRTGALNEGTFPLPSEGDVKDVIEVADPWGTPIIYTREELEIKKESNATDPAFTLTSYGPDGVLAGGDDVIEVINVGEMQSIFTNYGW